MSPNNSLKVAAVNRAIRQTTDLLTESQDHQQRREQWFDEHADIVDRYDIVRRAETHRRTKIAANPQHFLTGTDRGPAPLLQRDRRTQHDRLVAEAVARDMAAPELPSANAESAVELG
ncbi:MAG: hypothetical protein V9E94_03680 [Microthrixaceae bacterium]